MLIIDAIDELLLDTDSAGRRPKTARFYRRQLESFAGWCENWGVIYVQDITASLLGHSKVALLIRYLPIAAADLRDIHARFGPLSRYKEREVFHYH